MSSSGQSKGSCGHIMASFDSHQKCEHCHEKGVGTNRCVLGEESCPLCAATAPEERVQLSVCSYKQKKEKKKDKSEKVKKLDKLVDLSSVLLEGCCLG